MAIYYSATTNSFYDSNIIEITQMPEDSKIVTDANYKALMDAQCYGHVITANSDGTPCAITQQCGPCSGLMHDLTIATANKLGHVKGGGNVSIDANGVMNANIDLSGYALDSNVVHKTGNETIAGTKTFSNTTISNKELHYKDTKYDWSDTSLNVWCDAGNVAWFDKTGNRRMHELVGAQNGVWRKVCYINEKQYFYVDSNRNINYWGTSFKFNDKNIALDENLVHRSGDEIINGTKIFYNTISRHSDLTTSGTEQVYNFYDTNANSCGHIFNNVHWHANAIYNRHGAYGTY